MDPCVIGGGRDGMDIRTSSERAAWHRLKPFLSVINVMVGHNG